MVKSIRLHIWHSINLHYVVPAVITVLPEHLSEVWCPWLIKILLAHNKMRRKKKGKFCVFPNGFTINDCPFILKTMSFLFWDTEIAYFFYGMMVISGSDSVCVCVCIV